MDGKGRWRDNVFVERLWRNVKYEDIYLKAYGSIIEVKKDLLNISHFTTNNGGIEILTENPGYDLL